MPAKIPNGASTSGVRANPIKIMNKTNMTRAVILPDIAAIANLLSCASALRLGRPAIFSYDCSSLIP
jgi:hypothetical protein